MVTRGKLCPWLFRCIKYQRFSCVLWLNANPRAKLSEEMNKNCCPRNTVVQFSTPAPTLSVTIHSITDRQQTDGQTAVCTVYYKCLHQLVAPYLVSMISQVSAVSTCRHLCSAGQGDLPSTSGSGQLDWSGKGFFFGSGTDLISLHILLYSITKLAC